MLSDFFDCSLKTTDRLLSIITMMNFEFAYEMILYGSPYQLELAFELWSYMRLINKLYLKSKDISMYKNRDNIQDNELCGKKGTDIQFQRVTNYVKWIDNCWHKCHFPCERTLWTSTRNDSCLLFVPFQIHICTHTHTAHTARASRLIRFNAFFVQIHLI